MNSLIELKPGIIGSESSLQQFSTLESCTFIVVSDSHGNALALQNIISTFGPQSDALVFCGDGIDDIAVCLNHAKTNKSFADKISPLIFCVQGNNDPPHFNIQEKTYTIPSEIIFSVASHTILAAHGHQYNTYTGTTSLEQAALIKNSDIVFYGHTHVAQAACSKSVHLFNPGSCSKPRGCNASFCIVKIFRAPQKTQGIFYLIQTPVSLNPAFKIFTPSTPYWW